MVANGNTRNHTRSGDPRVRSRRRNAPAHPDALHTDHIRLSRQVYVVRPGSPEGDIGPVYVMSRPYTNDENATVIRFRHIPSGTDYVLSVQEIGAERGEDGSYPEAYVLPHNIYTAEAVTKRRPKAVIVMDEDAA